MTTKIHTTVDALGHPMGFHLTPGQTHDLEGADVLLKATQADTVIADKAYDAQARVETQLHQAGKTMVVVIPRQPRESISAAMTCTCTRRGT